MGRLKKGEVPKVRVATRLDKELVEWALAESGSGKRFANLTHALETALALLRREEESQKAMIARLKHDAIRARRPLDDADLPLFNEEIIEDRADRAVERLKEEVPELLEEKPAKKASPGRGSRTATKK